MKIFTLAKDHRIVFGEFAAALSVGHLLIFKLLIFLSPCVLISLGFEGMRGDASRLDVKQVCDEIDR
jgi:hypothetical protein